MKSTLYAFLVAAFFVCCLGCGGPSGPGGEAYTYATEWNEFTQAKKDENQQMQVEALEKILAKDPEAVDPNGQPIKTMLKYAKEGKLQD